MGVYIGQSTGFFVREKGEIHEGRAPADSVVVPGNLPSKCGTYSLYAAIIVKKVNAKTCAKIGINTLLRSVSEEKSFEIIIKIAMICYRYFFDALKIKTSTSSFTSTKNIIHQEYRIMSLSIFHFSNISLDD